MRSASSSRARNDEVDIAARLATRVRARATPRRRNPRVRRVSSELTPQSFDGCLLERTHRKNDRLKPLVFFEGSETPRFVLAPTAWRTRHERFLRHSRRRGVLARLPRRVEW
jgi:hypothetical protein